MHKLPLRPRDLAYFEPRDLPPMPAAALHAELVAQAIRRRAHADSVSLLGYLYVLEGQPWAG